MPNDINILPNTYLLYMKCTLLYEASEVSEVGHLERKKETELCLYLSASPWEMPTPPPLNQRLALLIRL